MENDLLIEDLGINQRFILASQTYLVVNVDFNVDLNYYVVTARSEDAQPSMLELKIQPGTIFNTLRRTF